MAEQSAEENVWPEAIARVLSADDQPRLVMQPVVDLKRGRVAGYEALSRFDGPPNATPDRWFDAAARLGKAVPLELRVIERGLAMRDALPPETFLSLNVSPSTLLREEAMSMLRRAGNLGRIVFELTEHERVADYAALKAAVGIVRAAGAVVAVDDAGAGYASLQHVLELRPQFVKLDRKLIEGVDTDPAKRAIVRMLGEFASRIDAWIIAEGIERAEELKALTELRVPLGQGYFLARPEPPWCGLRPEARAALGDQPSSEDRRTVVALLAPTPVEQRGGPIVTTGLRPCTPAVVVGDEGRPVGLAYPDRPGVTPTLVITPDTGLVEAARRASARPNGLRLEPLVCWTASGGVLGLVHVERLLEVLAEALQD